MVGLSGEGGDHVGFRHIRELQMLFGHPGDALILLCLDRDPLRFTQLGTEVVKRFNTRLGDTQINRSLQRLKRSQLVETFNHADGHHGYRLTPAGKGQAKTLDAIIALQAGLDEGTQPPTTSPP